MPILLRELDAPEMRARAEKLDADARTFLRCVAHVDDAALLLFLGGGIDEDQFRPEFEHLIQIEQAAVGVDHDRLALGAKSPAFYVLPFRMNGDAREDTGATPLAACLRSWHRHNDRAMRAFGSQLRRSRACPKKQFAKMC
jgi:hypothetical protein